MTSPDDRSQLAVAYTWAARVMAVSIEMVTPGLLGYWVDLRLKTNVVFTVLGLVFGMVAGMRHLLRMTKSIRNEKDSDGTAK